ncbi:hypothetical protein [Aeribacillus alveayuensis]|uniref:Uncharacterized protein n=1 Tax=Aeribacillus alveayuensis TaxID=279215 RepID=A0ABT9VNG1_9BACI|nr:hypothetical protein [Bacillus alveayuensis]
MKNRTLFLIYLYTTVDNPLFYLKMQNRMAEHKLFFHIPRQETPAGKFIWPLVFLVREGHAYSMPSRQANRLPTPAEKLEIEPSQLVIIS